jgi:hypothetical protein
VVNLVDAVNNAYDDAGHVQADPLSEFVTALGMDTHFTVVASTLGISQIEQNNQLEVNNNNAVHLNCWLQHIKPET